MFRCALQNMDRIVRLNADIHRVETRLMTFVQLMIEKAASGGGRLIKVVLGGSGLIINIAISCSGKVIDFVVTRSARVVHRSRLGIAQLTAMSVAIGVHLFETCCCRGAQFYQQASIRGDELIATTTAIGGMLSAEGGHLLEQARARGTRIYRNASANGSRMIGQASTRLGTTTYQLAHVLSTGGLRLVSRVTSGGGYLMQRATSGGSQCLSLLGGGGVRLLKPLVEGCDWLQDLIEEYKQQTTEAEPQAKDMHGWKLYGPKELRLLSVVCGIPKQRAECPKLGQNGKDAWFAASTSRGDTLGVADGVGCGWISHHSPGELSSSLMRSCERLAQSPSHDPRRLDLLLHRANCALQEVRHQVLASCHTCLLSLDRRTGTVTATNIGGCGFLVVRKGQIVARSIARQLQVSPYLTCPTSLPFLGVGTFLYGDINRPAVQQFRAQSEDMLLLATDGFFDNVDDGCVLSLINELAGGTDPRRMRLYAETLAMMARAATCGTTPPKETRHKKMDDITVVLAVVN